jgi:hypothetical protein
MNIHLIILIVACVLDVGATAKNLAGGGKELNYLPAVLMAKLGRWPVMIGVKVLCIVAAVLIAQPGFTDGLALANAIGAGYSFWQMVKKPSVKK